ncbi:MAG TPA: BON domain-containing protein, partial [Vicinamibacteria bacterium]|nr:BON domain-containing protein [Vicinamibacteria bacterium]
GRVKGRQVSVETREGVVTLRGKVDSDAAKAAAEILAREVEGVRDVRNELAVVSPADRARVDRQDKALTRAVKRALARDVQLEDEDITVRVDAAVVTLGGEVSSFILKSKAAEVAWQVAGIREVRNELVLD